MTSLQVAQSHAQSGRFPDMLAAGRRYMAHKGGFTEKTLTQALLGAGFKSIAGKRRTRGLDLWVVASKGEINEMELRKLAGTVLPG